MKNVGFQSVILGTIAVLGIFIAVLQGTSSVAELISQTVDGALTGGRGGIESQFDTSNRKLGRQRDSLLAMGGLLAGVESYTASQAALREKTISVNNSTKQTQRLATMKNRLGKSLSNFRSENHDISGVVLWDVEGNRIVAGPGGEAIVKQLPRVILRSLKAGGTVYQVGVVNSKSFVGRLFAPVRNSQKTIIAVVMLETELSLSWNGAGKAISVMKGPEAVYGQALLEERIPAITGVQSFVAAAGNGYSRFDGIGAFSFAPLFVESDQISVQAVEFALPGSPELRGFLTLDAAPLYADLGGIQYALILLGLVLLLCNAMLGFLNYRRFAEPINIIADSIAATLQGTVIGAVDDSRFSQELARLNQLVRKVLVTGKVAGAGSLGSAAPNPTPSAVELYGTSGGMADFASMDFYGNLDSVQLDELAFGPVAASAEVIGAGGSSRALTNEVGEADDFGLGLESGPMAAELPAAFSSSNVASFKGGSAIADLFSMQSENSLASEVKGDYSPSASIGVLESSGQGTKELGLEEESEFNELVGVEALADFKPGDSIQEAASLNQLTTDSKSISGATSVMKISPQLMAQLRDEELDSNKDEHKGVDVPFKETVLTSNSGRDVETSIADLSALAKEIKSQGNEHLNASRASHESIPVVAPLPPMRKEAPTVVVAGATELRDVYNDFISTRRQCGESTEFPFVKFVARLEKSKEAVKTKHGCQDVKFQVYIKNGKAALKASPIR